MKLSLLSLPRAAAVVSLLSLGAVLPVSAVPLPAGALISEFRLRGPSPGGANNEFIEIYNPSALPLTVQATDGSAGWGVAASDGVVRFVIPNGTVLPGHGHFLGANSLGYQLTAYPGGNGPTTPDATWTTDIPDNAGIALFSSSTALDLAHRLDAVGSTNEANTLYKEGAGYPAILAINIDPAFTRECTHGAHSPNDENLDLSDGEPHDTNDNAPDFVFVDTNGSSVGAGQLLGSAGPQNLGSPIAAYHGPVNLGMALVDPTLTVADAPNRVRDFTSMPAVNSTSGSLELVRQFTNDTGAPLTQLRFRIVKITTFPAVLGIADLRPITSGSGLVSTAGGNVAVSGTTLEQPPGQPNGGGWNSSFSVNDVNPGNPLAPGASVAVRFHFGIQQTGVYRVGLLAEALPTVSHFWVATGDTESPAASAEQVPVETLPEIVLEQTAGVELATGDSVAFATAMSGAVGETKTFTIKNTGTAALNLGTPSVENGDALDFVVDASAVPAFLPPAGEATFTVTFTPTAVGLRAVSLHLQSDDANESSIDVTLTGEATPALPTFATIAAKDGAVPNAGPGGDPRIQEGATWTGFGTPAVSGSGSVAYIGKWHAAAQKTPVVLKAQSGIGIFVDDTLIVKVGDPVPGIANAVFKSFKDPVIDDLGHLAFIAGIKGNAPGVVIPSNSDTVVVSNAHLGELEVLAREGSPAPDTAGATFKTFGNVSIKVSQVSIFAGEPRGFAPAESAAGIVFTAALNRGSGPGITAANDTGAWVLPQGASLVRKLVLEGDQSEQLQGIDTVKTFSVLRPVGGSLGFGRGHVDGDLSLFFATGVNHAVGIYSFREGSYAPAALLGDSLNSFEVPEGKWAKLALPSADVTGQNITMLGSLKTGPLGVPFAQAKGIFQSHDGGADWEPVVRSGDFVPGFPKGATFTSFKDPLNAPDCADVAFVGSTKGTGVTTATNDGLWFQPDFAPLMLIAREGDEPPGAPGAKWKGFSSVALSGGESGPLFTATLQKGLRGAAGPGGITGANDFGLYCTNYFTGAVTELVREGNPLLGKTVKNFSVLKAAGGSAGTSRAFNAQHQVVLLVNFTDRSTAIVGIQIPENEPPRL